MNDNTKTIDDQNIDETAEQPVDVQLSEADKLQQEVEEWKGKYLRALADYQNMERRRSEQRIQELQFASKEFVVKILPVLDVLYHAQAHLKDKGLELAIKQFLDVLKGEQVVKIDVLGKLFDPHTMECIEVVEGEKDDTVVEEVQAGYMMHDKVIRVASVKVSEKKK
jgi:molecular chaperone GrpE